MARENIKIIIAAGGTGGHLYPGIALARELKAKGCEPIFIVKKSGLGHAILQKEGFKYYEIPMIGLPRALSPRLLLLLYCLIRSFFTCSKIIENIKPSIIVGMGSYVSFPVVIIGRIKKVKVVLHEQNYTMGLANKCLFPMASVIAASFEGTEKYFPSKKTVITGNPLRRELFDNVSDDVFRKYGLLNDRFTVLIFGGSQGAKKINQVMMEALSFIVDVKEIIQFIHLVGNSDVSDISKQYKNRGFVACVMQYLDRIGEAYSMSDLIICRAGATTVAEIEIFNTPAILIPYPYATNNHQEHNAVPLVNSGRAELIKEKDLKGDLLSQKIKTRHKAFRRHDSKIQLPYPFPQEKLANLILATYDAIRPGRTAS